MDEWRVELDSLEHHDGCRGSTYLAARTIKIDPTNNPQQQRATFIHELLHVVAHYIGSKGNLEEKFSEEEWIERLAPVLTLILEENKHIFNS